MKAEPLLDAYWAWVEKLDPAAGSKLEDAVTYAQNQKQYLNTFLYLSLFLDEIRYLGRTPANALLESLLPWSAQIQKIVKHLE